jgi:hypothetical protein
MQRSAVNASADQRSEAPDRVVGDAVTETVADTTADGAADSVVVHVQLRPRRGATRKCLAALAALAVEHPSVAFAVTGLSKDDRVVRVTVGVDLGPRYGVAKFSPQAQAAYAFVSAVFTTLYDHMPVYSAEPSETERAAAATLLEVAARPLGGLLDSPTVTDPGVPDTDILDRAAPTPRPGGWGARVSA